MYYCFEKKKKNFKLEIGVFYSFGRPERASFVYLNGCLEFVNSQQEHQKQSQVGDFLLETRVW
jgi:hypothetical protein